MNQWEHDTYWRPARVAIVDYYPDLQKSIGTWEHDYDASKKLAGLLGYRYPKEAYWDWIKLTPELKHQLKLIVGPYGETIIKMLELKRVDKEPDHSGATPSQAG